MSDNKSKFSVEDLKQAAMEKIEGIIQASMGAKNENNNKAGESKKDIGIKSGALITEKRILLDEGLSKELTSTLNSFEDRRETFTTIEQKETKSVLGKTKMVDVEVPKERNYFYNTVFNLVLVELPFSNLKVRARSDREEFEGNIQLHMVGTDIEPIFITNERCLGKFFNNLKETQGWELENGDEAERNEEFIGEKAYVVYLESSSLEGEGRPERSNPNILITAGIVNKLSLSSEANGLSDYNFNHFLSDDLKAYTSLHDVSDEALFGLKQSSELVNDYKVVQQIQVEEKQSWGDEKWLRWGVSRKGGITGTGSTGPGSVMLLVLAFIAVMITDDAWILWVWLGLHVLWFVFDVKRAINNMKNHSLNWSTFDYYRKYSYLEAMKRSSTPEGVARTPILKIFKDVEAHTIKS